MRKNARKIKNINLCEIKPNPYQVRRNFNLRKTEMLAESIRKYGILSPLLLRMSRNGYEIISGSRRYRAAIIAGMKTVPAIIVSAGDRQCAELNLIENIQREELTVFEKAEAYYNLLSYHGIKKSEIADALSVKPEEISEKVKLLGALPEIRYKAEEYKIAEESVVELIKLHDEEKQKEITELIIKEKLSPEDTASLVKQINGESLRKRKGKNKVTNIPLCRNTVKRTVNLLKESGEKVEFEQNEDEKHLEFRLKIKKQGIF